MQRYFVSEDQLNGSIVTITGDDVKHIARVMRMQEGEEIIVSNNAGRTVLAKLKKLSESDIQAEVLEELDPKTELPIKVTVAQGLPKGDKLELITQKGTELGVSCFQPFQASRSIVKWDMKKAKKKVERLEKIAKEAAEQSYREIIPTIKEAASFTQLLETIESYTHTIVAYEESAKTGEASNLHNVLNQVKSGDSVLIVIGPEGGLTEEEVSALEGKGAVLCGLGPRIIRTETAPLYVMAAISYHLELMR
ncbi:RNA methyltransferase, RsmE [Alkalihalophilus pseudofirmus OF4]|uniref:Ribosomal RNA small subunit methyltransferase E n=1 Tax=Alkalihalophilus pseudofirmus (strain ATCC BAA-2126 / JCM 17055 / OF4) TaxID=398511 RepID=D3FXL4_ALKPO|nr:16S rRNA (uracil(1498)-N(3))-methyltransferase [Alkalihalophilus pseudofirmus]ADC50725.1 RNA methyltransferase, RsmE [Alkalihalophilus pseudofirmus OF4]